MSFPIHGLVCPGAVLLAVCILCVCVYVTNTVTNTVCFSMPRCSILENDTVQCDTDLYRSLQAWKDHKLHIDHEVSDGFSVHLNHGQSKSGLNHVDFFQPLSLCFF